MIWINFSHKYQAPTSRLMQRLDALYERCLKRILHNMWKDRVRNDTILEWAAVPASSEIVTRGCIRFTDHILRLPEWCLTSLTTTCHTEEVGHTQHGGTHLYKTCRQMGITWEEAKDNAWDRGNWRLLAAQYSGQNWRNQDRCSKLMSFLWRFRWWITKGQGLRWSSLVGASTLSCIHCFDSFGWETGRALSL